MVVQSGAKKEEISICRHDSSITKSVGPQYGVLRHVDVCLDGYMSMCFVTASWTQKLSTNDKYQVILYMSLAISHWLSELELLPLIQPRYLDGDVFLNNTLSG